MGANPHRIHCATVSDCALLATDYSVIRAAIQPTVCPPGGYLMAGDCVNLLYFGVRAGVVELVDTQHSKCCAFGRVGSSPTTGTINRGDLKG